MNKIFVVVLICIVFFLLGAIFYQQYQIKILQIEVDELYTRTVNLRSENLETLEIARRNTKTISIHTEKIKDQQNQIFAISEILVKNVKNKKPE